MSQLRPTRRQLLQGTSGLVITFALGSVLESGGHAQEGAATPNPAWSRCRLTRPRVTVIQATPN